MTTRLTVDSIITAPGKQYSPTMGHKAKKAKIPTTGAIIIELGVLKTRLKAYTPECNVKLTNLIENWTRIVDK